MAACRRGRAGGGWRSSVSPAARSLVGSPFSSRSEVGRSGGSCRTPAAVVNYTFVTARMAITITQGQRVGVQTRGYRPRLADASSGGGLSSWHRDLQSRVTPSIVGKVWWARWGWAQLASSTLTPSTVEFAAIVLSNATECHKIPPNFEVNAFGARLPTSNPRLS